MLMCKCTPHKEDLEFCGLSGCRPRPTAPTSELYRHTHPGTGESNLVWVTRTPTQRVDGCPDSFAAATAPYPRTAVEFVVVFPVVHPVRGFPMFCDNFEDHITAEKGFKRVEDDWQLATPVSILRRGEHMLELRAAGALRVIKDIQRDDGVRYLYFEEPADSDKLRDTLSQVQTHVTHVVSETRSVSMYNCEIVSVPGQYGCIKYDAISSAANYRKQLERLDVRIDQLVADREAAVAGQDFITSALLRDQADEVREKRQNLQEEFVAAIYG